MEDTIRKIISEKSNSRWWNELEGNVIGKYGRIFDPANLDNLSKNDFKSFLLMKNNFHWEGIHRQGNMITADMAKLKSVLKILLDESKPLKDRLNKIFGANDKCVIRGLGKAVLTPILLVAYPNKYGVWNRRSEDALRQFNLFPRFSPRDGFAEKYIKINNVLTELTGKYGISLWQLDGILGDISGNSPESVGIEEGDGIEKELEGRGITDPINFGLESHLEDFLIDNWDKTIFGKEYDLIYDEGDLVSQQYQTGVGPIDILAFSKNKNDYLVIELKKGKPSDQVVGQILRYMAWIRKNLAKEKRVSGCVVVFETDDKLKYSLMGQQNISLYNYKVDFHLTREEIE
jgi:hypothetical protein